MLCGGDGLMIAYCRQYGKPFLQIIFSFVALYKISVAILCILLRGDGDGLEILARKNRDTLINRCF